jgi:hypothetical protein
MVGNSPTRAPFSHRCTRAADQAPPVTSRFIAGAADEARDEGVAGPVVELLRRADLLDDAVVHHHDPVGQVIASTWSWVT